MQYTVIQDVVVPTKGIGKLFYMTAISIPLPGTGASFYWSVSAEAVDPETLETQTGVVVLEGNLYMDDQTYSQWGTDDEYAIDWALQQLGFTKI
jgi:hypothetical protein